MKSTVLTVFLAFLLSFVACGAEGLGFDPEKNPDAVSTVYFAVENQILFRMRNPDGSYREFQRDFERPNDLWGVRGWRGKINGDIVTIKSGPDVVGGPVTYVFDRGRLVSFQQGEKKLEFAYDSPRLPTAGGMPFVFGDATEKAARKGVKSGKARRTGLSKKVQREVGKKWAKSGRLRIPFDNPNENGFLFMTCALFAAFLFYFENKVVKAIGAVVFLVGCGGMVMAASRGAFLSFAVAVATMTLPKWKTLLRSKAVWILAGVVLLGAVGYFATHESRLLTRGITTSKWSNQTRLEMWHDAPRMIADAPNGWGHMHIGRAHLDWYQELDEVSLSGSLINEHLTRLVHHTFWGRYRYILCWLAGIVFLGWVTWKTREGAALGMLLAVAIAGWFNPVYVNPFLRIVPPLAVIPFLCRRPWKALSVRSVLVLSLVAMGAAGAVLGGVIAYGKSLPHRRGFPIEVREGRIYVRGINPQTWIADDGRMLGGVLACKDIRGFYRFDPSAPSVGYVNKVKCLPRNGIHRLLLAGDAGEEWLKLFVSRVEKEKIGEAEAMKMLPQELVFLNPPFPPSGVPAPFLEHCKVRYLVGEFVARYDDEFAKAPDWVTVVPATEFYINGWMMYALGRL